MKVWILSIVGLILFIIGALCLQHYINTSSSHLDDAFKTVETALSKQQWEISKTTLAKAQSSWAKTKPTWALFLHHQEIDAIDQTLARTRQAIQTHSHPEAFIEIGLLRQIIKHVPERERLNWVNVL